MPLYTPPMYTQGFTAVSGQVQACSNTVTTAAVAVVGGQLSFMPFQVGEQPITYAGLECSVSSTVQVGGTTTTTLAAYPSLRDGSGPDMTGGPQASGTVTLGTTSARNNGATWVPTRGRWWLAFLYVVSSAPSTTAQLFCVASGLALPAVSSPGSTSRGLIATGQTVMPTTQIALTPSALTSLPALGARV